jgi:hypothetical protein
MTASHDAAQQGEHGSRIRNMFADGINMTNGSTDNLVSNNDARATGTTASHCSRRSTPAAPT